MQKDISRIEKLCRNNTKRLINLEIDMNQKFEIVNKRFDIVNNNIAKILTVQNKMFEELSSKLDKHIQVNNVEHKKFDYEIASIKMAL